MVFRGIIIEIKDKYSIVMKDNGSMIRVKNKEGLKVGDAILFLEEDIYGKKNVLNFADFKVWKPMIAVAACLMLVLLFAYNRNPYTDYALLSMDVNPSIQFKLDKDGNIVDVLGLNSYGENMIDEHLVGKPLEEGLSKLKLLMEENNFLKDDSPILVGFAYLEDINDDEYEENIKSIIKKIYSKNEILYLKSNSLRANESLKSKLSLGRLEALESIVDENIKANIESITVKEIKENMSKSNRTEVFNDDDMDEDDEDDDYDEIDDDWDHENSDNDHEDILEDKIDKKNNLENHKESENENINESNDEEKEDNNNNTEPYNKKDSNGDNSSNDSKNDSSDNIDSNSNTGNSSDNDSND